MKISNKRELQQIAFTHSSDIDFQDLVNLYKKCTEKPHSSFVIDTTLASDNPLPFRKNIKTNQFFRKNIKTNHDKCDQRRVIEQANWNFNDKVRPRSKADKEEKRYGYESANAHYQGRELTLNAFKSRIFSLKSTQGKGLKY